jgi:hypothetical protein
MKIIIRWIVLITALSATVYFVYKCSILLLKEFP